MNYDTILNCITIPTVRNRLRRDLVALQGSSKVDADVDVEIDTAVNNNAYPYKVTVYGDNVYQFCIPIQYPFVSPKVYVNGKPYLNILKFMHDNTGALYRSKRMYCFCCETILCGNKWNSIHTIGKIIEEYQTFRQYYREIFYGAVTNALKRKHLLTEIDLMQWLI